METAPKAHMGRKIARLRELRGMKQEALAQAMGVSQQTVSSLENSETIDDSRLNDVASALGITVEGIKAFSEEAVFTFFNTFNDNSSNHGVAGTANHCTFNPLDKLIEAYEENRKLYERLLEAEKEKNGLLERLSDK